MQLVDTVGWNQLPADWQRLMRVAPDGCFLAEWDGFPAGTATAVHYGTQCAWIGMVLVDPDFRRRGIGGALLAHCVEYLKSLGVKTIKLDATDEGRAVYLKHGFKDEYGTIRYLGELKAAAVRPSAGQLRPLVRERDMAALEALDSAVFGADRGCLLKVLIEQQPDVALVASEASSQVSRNHGVQGPCMAEPGFAERRLRRGENNAAMAPGKAGLTRHSDGSVVAEYGLARPGRLHGYIGPVVAGQMDVAKRLVAELAEQLEQRTFFVDTTALNPAWCHWLEDSGLRVQRRLTRMYLGANDSPGDPQRVYALSGFETG